MITSTTDKVGPTLLTALPQTIPVFAFQASSDLLVLDTGPTSGPYDPAVVLTLGSDYSITGGGYNAANAMQTGSVTLNSGGTGNVAVNDNIVVMRAVPVNQPTSLIETGPLTIALVEQSLDRLATIDQQLNEDIGRSLRFENFEFLNGVLPLNLRKSTLLGFSSGGAVQFFPLTQVGVNTVNPNYVTPEQFGCVGDGVTDDFTAWSAMVAYINALGGGFIMCGAKKTYFLNRFLTTLTPTNVPVFQSIQGLNIEGNGSTILVAGNFTRLSAAYSTLPGLQLMDCSEVSIRNLNLNGNNTTVNNSGAYDPPGYGMGLALYSCIDVTVENMTATNFITDGCYIDTDTHRPVGGKYIASKNVILKNCHFPLNCRQGMSVIQLRQGMFQNCSFSQTGQSAYGSAAPTAGVDIEPDFNISSMPTPIDVNTGILTFDTCVSFLNGGEILSCASFASVDSVTIENCRLVGIPNGRTGTTVGMSLSVPNATLRGNYIDMQDRDFDVSGATSSLCTTVIIGNEFHGYGTLLSDVQSSSLGCPVLTQGNRFYFTPPVSWVNVGASLYVAFLQNASHVFKDNFIFVSQNAFSAAVANSGGWILRAAINSIRYAEGNQWTTDLPASAFSGNTAQFIVSYNQAVPNAYFVLNDFFLGTAIGTADTFRPFLNNTVYDSHYPFSNNQLAAGFSLGMGAVNDVRQFTGTAAPSTGTWKVADIVWNNAAAAGGIPGWYCVTAGSPGTWKAMAVLAS